MMGQHQEIVAGSTLLRRLVLVLAVAAVVAALMVASVTPAFAAPNTTFTCFISNVRGSSQVAEGLSKGQAKQFETNNPDTFCVPAGQEQLEILTDQRKVPPGQQRKLAEESIAGVRQIAEETIVEEQPAEVFPAGQRQLADGLI
jgi:flagellar biosynthesis/type III secretory pathway M-ring protein FliF/YscJ